MLNRDDGFVGYDVSAWKREDKLYNEPTLYKKLEYEHQNNTGKWVTESLGKNPMTQLVFDSTDNRLEQLKKFVLSNQRENYTMCALNLSIVSDSSENEQNINLLEKDLYDPLVNKVIFFYLPNDMLDKMTKKMNKTVDEFFYQPFKDKKTKFVVLRTDTKIPHPNWEFSKPSPYYPKENNRDLDYRFRSMRKISWYGEQNYPVNINGETKLYAYRFNFEWLIIARTRERDSEHRLCFSIKKLILLKKNAKLISNQFFH
ncbi:hypothetical protein FJR74_00205 [Metamycoplasma neophronis]|uniref:Uncharacterized protein n=1 Tax=Metamycoplasma neophronis TaxID=872983 RepID=A0ABY2Z1I8_9BACT|nr:hypothetical protein FJR74_00205 [Metamycoplasma neophronis]